MKEIKILHITPHLGGGVGRVLLNYLEKVKGTGFSHKVICLEYANEKAILAAQVSGFSLSDKMSSNHDGIMAEVEKADIVLVHWWNHPLLNAFLVRESLPPARIIFWSHISGFHAPYVFSRPALNYPDLFVFTSPFSRDTQEVKKLPDARQKALRVIWSTGGIEHVASIMPKPHSGYRIGYIGTVDYSKMHPGFLKMSSLVKIPDVHFVIVGGPSERKIQEESLQYEMGKRFTFTGYVGSINQYLSEFDVFGYPLAPYHYGTCEQSLCESMAAGVPPVVLSNMTERYIVDDHVTGIVAAGEESYAAAIEELYLNPDLRRKLSDNARAAARRRFSLEKMVDSWDDAFNQVLNLPKTKREWTGRYAGKTVSPAHVFLESLGESGLEFQASLNAETESEKKAAAESIRKLYGTSPLWRSDTRGNPHHYHYFFPEDGYLKLWCDLEKME
ncbi:MAG: glycosyltransferase family 4 protein [Candidatus Wallbacteria bacterium]|nr:glycosyltransferase family 4 protein [Candidatus Wallbacteria bacterium]